MWNMNDRFIPVQEEHISNSKHNLHLTKFNSASELQKTINPDNSHNQTNIGVLFHSIRIFYIFLNITTSEKRGMFQVSLQLKLEVIKWVKKGETTKIVTSDLRTGEVTTKDWK